ncbi:MAG: hypothetical protein ACK4N5_05535 [Myxococcales bacterium]
MIATQNELHPLRHALALATAAGPKGVLAFDLDSTLFDNRPRQVVILREFGVARNVPALAEHRAEHWKSGWDMLGAMVRAGMPQAEAEALYEDAKQFWRERFFTSAYCVHDVQLAGAAAFMNLVLQTQARVAYVTGRHEEMRAGTVEAMRKEGLPLPDDARVHLIMKPTVDMDDDAFKREAHAQLRALGTVVAAFDNEPTHANDYKKNFPEAFVVRLATDHSGRPYELREGVVEVPDFVVPAP